MRHRGSTVPERSGVALSFCGRHLTSVDQLSSSERQRFLKTRDPMNMYELKPETLVYRSMPAEHLVNGQVSGNPNSRALIRDHERLMPNPLGGGQPGTAEAYWTMQRPARELGPSLNVMAGTRALETVSLGYNRTGQNITVEMKLGDFLERGGKVYRDESAVSGDRQKRAIPLIVTLPEGESVPAKIVG
ncbi:hypothetical protein BZL41_16955 [Pseudomonas sp. PIC25]|nr:hypothetical protein BZL41_16955 [Pseudomonas sp. PIC25]